MSISTTMILSTIVVALLLSSTVRQVQAQNWNNRAVPVTCSICRSTSRPLLSLEKSFTMPNGLSWTCDYLQQTVQDVDEQSSYESERIMCRQAQLQAEEGGCECGGDPLPPLMSQFTDLNGACNLCDGQSSPVVPIDNYNAVVQTNVVGSMNCKGLYDAMIDGVLSANLCPTVQAAAGSTCCNTKTTTISSASYGEAGYDNSAAAAATTPVPVPVITPTTPAPLPVIDTSYTTSYTTSYNNGGSVPASSSTTATAPEIPYRIATPAPEPVTTTSTSTTTSYSLTTAGYSDAYTQAVPETRAADTDASHSYLRAAHDSIFTDFP
mmetsp:Transcript_36017/g.39024  ORF Transcript_36017/g.39024 Transcript_36017/m.39024 type:complete len:323 (-) Transcript_36017:341-1309(-)